MTSRDQRSILQKNGPLHLVSSVGHVIMLQRSFSFKFSLILTCKCTQNYEQTKCQIPLRLSLWGKQNKLSYWLFLLHTHFFQHTNLLQDSFQCKCKFICYIIVELVTTTLFLTNSAYVQVSQLL